MFIQDSVLETKIETKIETKMQRQMAQVFFTDRCLHQVFETQVAQHPDAVAVRFGEAELTYSELNIQANQLAHYLQLMGVGPEVMVGLCVERSLDAIVGMLAILKAGGAYVPLDPAYPQDRLTYMLQDTNVPLLITRTDTGTQLQPLLAAYPGKVVYLDREQEPIGRQQFDNVASAVSPNNLMYVIYTSGSTGKPKGIMVTHANVLRLFQATQPYLTFDEKDVWTLFHSYSFGFSVWEIWGALFHGAKLVIVPPATSQSPDDFYHLVCQEKITVLSQTPSAFSLFRLADATAKQTHHLNLRYIIFSGEALESTLLESWITRHGDETPQLINMYAISETAGEITYRRLTTQALGQATRSVIGVPLPDVEIYLLDEDKQPVPKGEAGEMYVSSAAVARGYLNLPELTTQRFMADPFKDQAQARMYKTGDRARYLPNGEIEFLGRMDDQVKIRGYRVEPSEIQTLLARHPAIAETVVVAQSDAANTTRLVAYIVPQPPRLAADQLPEAQLTTTALQRYLKAELPEYMIPSVFVKLDRLPRSPNGKIDRQRLPLPEHIAPPSPSTYVAQTPEEKALAQMWGLGAEPVAPLMSAPAKPVTGLPIAGVLLQNDASETTYVAPQTPMEKALAQIWAEVLRRPTIGLHDDFLLLGGNSLLAAQILYRMNDEFNVNLSMRQLLDTSTVAALATLITQSQAEQVESDELADILAGLAAFSDAEVHQLLAEQTDQQPDGETIALSTTHASDADMAQHEHYMRLAISKAKQAIGDHQTPIAACIVKDGEVIACVYNAVAQTMDVTAHAEMQAIREACRHLNTIDLAGCVLYSTLEPCPMCFSASHWANIAKIVYGARRDDAEKFGLGHNTIPVHAMKALGKSSIELVEDTLRAENLQVFDLWLAAKGAQHTQYDEIAAQFRQIKDSPVNTYITDYTFFQMIGDLDRGKAVLDLACGEGRYCRTLKQRGAARVVGVDISSQMIKLAEQQETQAALGIDYICQDVLELGKIGEFDLVVASFLLNYAQSKEQLVQMCRTVFDNLKPGGHFILLNENFNQAPQDFCGYERYGYAKTLAEPHQEGAVITYTMSTGTEELRFDGYYWSPATYQMAFATAGFTTVQLRELACSPQGIEAYGQRFWQNFIANPPFIGIICQK